MSTEPEIDDLALKIKKLEARWAELKSKKKSIEYIDVINELAYESAFAKPKRSKRLASEAEKIAKTLGYLNGEACAIRTHAYHNMMATRLIEAVTQAKVAVEKLREADNTFGLGTAHDILCLTYNFLGNYDVALENALAAHHCFQLVNYKRGIGWSLHNQGNIYTNLDDNSNALKYYREASRQFQQISYGPGLFRVLERTGVIYLKQGKHDRAIKAFERCLQYWRDSGFSIGLVSGLTNLGEAYLKKRDYTKAKEYLYEAVKSLNDIENLELKAQTYLLLGNVYRQEKQLEKTIECLQTALGWSEKSGSNSTLCDIHQALSEVYERQQEYHKALIHNRIASDLRREIFSEDARTRFKNIQISQEIEAAERESELQRVRLQETQSILTQILPDSIVDELLTRGRVKPVHFKNASVLFTDFVGFTRMTAKMPASKLVSELDKCFTAFDKLIKKYRLEKLKTIGDSYMAVGGVPASSSLHAVRTVLAGLAMLDYIKSIRQKRRYWQVRIGINSGPLVAGVICKDKFSYDIWGNTVNTASRMESSGKQGRLNISRQTYELIKDYFNCTYRGKVAAKGKGRVDMFFVNSLKKEYRFNGSPNKPNQKLQKLIQ